MDCLCYADEAEQLIYRLELAQRVLGRPTQTRWEQMGEGKTHKRVATRLFNYWLNSEKIPPMAWISVTVEPHQKGGRLTRCRGM
jgi:hypothetical protein